MYTAITFTNKQVVFCGNYEPAYLENLLMRQMGFLCRREIILKQFGNLMHQIVTFNPSLTTSTSTIIEILLEKTSKNKQKLAELD
jgi:hypothetical protein